MLTINPTANIPTNVINYCNSFMKKLERYNGSIYLGVVGRFMLLVKSGMEEKMEAARLVKPVRNALDAAQLGLCAGAESALWASYRQLFGKAETLEAVWSDENAIKKGGVQINEDYSVFMYPKPVTVDNITLHGDHCRVSFDSGKCVRIETTHYEPYREAEADIYNGTMSRVLNEKELVADAKYHAGNRKPVYGSDSDRLHDLRIWLDEQHAQGNGENAEDEMLEYLVQRASRLFMEAGMLRKRVATATTRVNNAQGRKRTMLGRDLIDLDIEQRAVYHEALVTNKLHDHLEQLIIDRLNGGFEEQNFEFGGQVREVCNMWQDAFDMRDMTSTERLHHHFDIAEMMA